MTRSLMSIGSTFLDKTKQIFVWIRWGPACLAWTSDCTLLTMKHRGWRVLKSGCIM